MRRQLGQAMAEYIVVASALVGAFFWTANADCPGYDNCLSALLTTMHDKYEGYGRSLTGVHHYEDLPPKVFDSEWEDNSDDVDNPGSESGAGPGALPAGASAVDALVASDGNIVGFLRSGSYVVDADGNIIGEYLNGQITFDDDSTEDVNVERTVVDEDGNELELSAIVICGVPNLVLGFGYFSLDGDTVYLSLDLEAQNATAYCAETIYDVVSTDGATFGGGVVGTNYYASFFTNEIGAVTPTGEVVRFNFEIPEDEGLANEGTTIDDCAIMATGWDANPDKEPGEVYLGNDNGQLGFVEDGRLSSCPSGTTVDEYD